MNPLSPISLRSFLPTSIVRWRSPHHLAGIACATICWGMLPLATGATPSSLLASAKTPPSSVEHPELSVQRPPLFALDPLDPNALDFRDSGTSTNTVGGASRLFPDFRGAGRPGNHGGGASRGICPSPSAESQTASEEAPLTLLVPQEAKYGGRTTKPNPNLWAYVPYPLNADSPITFYLLDGDGNTIYETFQVIDHEPGILKLDLPANVTLETGQVYEWYLMLHCNDPSGMDVASFASGWIERVPDPATDDVADLSLVEQSHFYANQLIWYDALNILADGLLSAPNDPQIINAWADLLSLPSVQLDLVSTEPIRDCCRLFEQP